MAQCIILSGAEFLVGNLCQFLCSSTAHSAFLKWSLLKNKWPYEQHRMKDWGIRINQCPFFVLHFAWIKQECTHIQKRVSTILLYVTSHIFFKVPQPTGTAFGKMYGITVENWQRKGNIPLVKNTPVLKYSTLFCDNTLIQYLSLWIMQYKTLIKIHPNHISVCCEVKSH